MKFYTKRTFQIYLTHMKKHRAMGLLLLVFIVLGSLTAISIPLYYKQFFDVLTGFQDTPLNARADLVRVLMYITVLHSIEWVLWRGAAFTNNVFQPRVIQSLSNSCFQYLHKHSFGFFHDNFVGSLVKRVNQFVGAFESILDNITWYVLRLIVNTAAILVVLFQRSFLLGGIIICWIALFLVINWFLTKFKYKYDVQRGDAETAVTKLLADTITNQSNVKLFNGYSREVESFRGATEHVRKLRKFTWDLDTLFDGAQGGLMVMLEVLIFYVAIGYWQRGILTVGDFVLIQAYLLTIFDQVWNFGRTIRHMYERLAEAQEMTKILEAPHEIQDVVEAKPLTVTAGKIEFKEVNFFYHQTRHIIHDFNLTIEPGEKLAFIGPSGAGKSTITKLLLRVHDVGSGKILIDGQKIIHVTQESLWQHTSLVPQEPILFHRSLMDNIRYGRPEATDAEVIEASKRAHCHEFILHFPEGYETLVGERGVKLSGGERQRVAIARAILRNAPILVMDEATSSLDSESESLIQDALENLMKGKTVIVIAHRLSTIMKMDRIVVLDHGKIVEEGSHKTLLEKDSGLYKKLWQMQAGGFID